jgi:hypothetical protein
LVFDCGWVLLRTRAAEMSKGTVYTKHQLRNYDQEPTSNDPEARGAGSAVHSVPRRVRGGDAGCAPLLACAEPRCLGTGVAWPMAARVPALTQTEDFFLIVAGLYSVTALRENDNERATVYTKHRLTPHYNQLSHLGTHENPPATRLALCPHLSCARHSRGLLEARVGCGEGPYRRCLAVLSVSSIKSKVPRGAAMIQRGDTRLCAAGACAAMMCIARRRGGGAAAGAGGTGAAEAAARAGTCGQAPSCVAATATPSQRVSGTSARYTRCARGK